MLEQIHLFLLFIFSFVEKLQDWEFNYFIKTLMVTFVRANLLSKLYYNL